MSVRSSPFMEIPREATPALRAARWKESNGGIRSFYRNMEKAALELLHIDSRLQFSATSLRPFVIGGLAGKKEDVSQVSGGNLTE